jgi:hypothetical protein
MYLYLITTIHNDQFYCRALSIGSAVDKLADKLAERRTKYNEDWHKEMIKQVEVIGLGDVDSDFWKKII